MTANINAHAYQDLADAPKEGWLNRIERLGNALPDPVMLFVIMIVLLMTASAIGAALGWQAANPVTGELLVTKSLFGEDMIRRLLTELPRTFAAFPPLGIVLALVIGAGAGGAYSLP